VSHKKLSKPAAWKNTYFWIAGILLIIAIYGLITKEDTIRDPGQRRETGLVWYYFAASILMLVNGVLSHRQTVRHYEETVGPLNTTGEERAEPAAVEQGTEVTPTAQTEETRELNG
jgi:hypothetical protein